METSATETGKYGSATLQFKMSESFTVTIPGQEKKSHSQSLSPSMIIKPKSLCTTHEYSR